jgi:hypothetical protein
MRERRNTGIASFIGDLKRSRAAAAPAEHGKDAGVFSAQEEGREAAVVAVLEESREPARVLESPPIQPHRASRKGPGRPAGKSSNPDYTQYSVKLRIATHDEAIENLRKRARRQGKSPNRIDFSDLVEELLTAWNRNSLNKF